MKRLLGKLLCLVGIHRYGKCTMRSPHYDGCLRGGCFSGTKKHGAWR